MDGTIPWVSPKDFRTHFISDAQDKITEDAVADSATNIVPAGAVLIVTRSGILSNSLPLAVTVAAVAINQDVKALVLSEGISPDYVAAALRRFDQEILAGCTKTGTTVPSILTQKFRDFRIPIAPSREQIRVVASIEAMFARLNNARDAMRTMEASVASYQRAALGAAFRGDATRMWRKIQKQAGADIGAGERSPSNRDDGVDIASPSPNFAEIFGVRDDTPWPFVTLESVCDPVRKISYGIIQTGDDTDGGVPTVRAGDIKNFEIDVNNLKRVRRELSDRYPRTLLRGGEVLVSIRGTTGNVAVAGSDMTGINVSREVAVIPLLAGVEPKFVAYALASPAGQEIITRQVKGVAQSGINLVDLRRFPLPLPARSEQLEMIAFVDEALLRLNSVKGHSEEITQSLSDLSAAILRKAFQGELTNQNHDDEPAGAVIARAGANPTPARSKRRLRKADKKQGDLFRRQKVPQSRKDVEADYLRTIVAKASAESLPVKELYLRSDMEIDEFYKQLAIEVTLGHLRQNADKTRLELTDAT